MTEQTSSAGRDIDSVSGDDVAVAGLEEVELSPGFVDRIARRGTSRRRFLTYCAGLTATLALPRAMTGRVAQGLAAAAASPQSHSVVWLAFQDCAGCVESFLRSEDPDVASLVLGMISLDYHETLMAAAGAQAEAAKKAALAKPGYLLIVEGAIPTGDIAGACTIGGRSAKDLLAEAVRWNEHTSWPVAAGHGCVGCSEPDFWDSMTPFYGRLPNVSGFGVEATADHIGETVVIGTAALFAAHGVGKLLRPHP